MKMRVAVKLFIVIVIRIADASAMDVVVKHNLSSLYGMLQHWVTMPYVNQEWNRAYLQDQKPLYKVDMTLGKQPSTVSLKGSEMALNLAAKLIGKGVRCPPTRVENWRNDGDTVRRIESFMDVGHREYNSGKAENQNFVVMAIMLVNAMADYVIDDERVRDDVKKLCGRALRGERGQWWAPADLRAEKHDPINDCRLYMQGFKIEDFIKTHDGAFRYIADSGRPVNDIEQNPRMLDTSESNSYISAAFQAIAHIPDIVDYVGEYSGDKNVFANAGLLGLAQILYGRKEVSNIDLTCYALRKEMEGANPVAGNIDDLFSQIFGRKIYKVFRNGWLCDVIGKKPFMRSTPEGGALRVAVEPGAHIKMVHILRCLNTTTPGKYDEVMGDYPLIRFKEAGSSLCGHAGFPYSFHWYTPKAGGTTEPQWKEYDPWARDQDWPTITKVTKPGQQVYRLKSAIIQETKANGSIIYKTIRLIPSTKNALVMFGANSEIIKARSAMEMISDRVSNTYAMLYERHKV
jgi:hypothetical protein